MILKVMRGMLSKFISLSTEYDVNNALDEDMEEEEEEDEGALPVDVKEGCFAVCTVDDGSLRRCVVELSFLSHPGFLKLLELAEKEFGFEQMGILVIPCTYIQLQSVISTNEMVLDF